MPPCPTATTSRSNATAATTSASASTPSWPSARRNGRGSESPHERQTPTSPRKRGEVERAARLRHDRQRVANASQTEEASLVFCYIGVPNVEASGNVWLTREHD